MATGITKLEQMSDDALTARDLSVDTIPLPLGKADIQLTYEGKASEKSILSSHSTQFLSIDSKGKSSKPSSNIPDNSLVLADNYVCLHTLLNENRKVNLFYLDPPYATGMDFHSRDLEHAYKDTMGDAAYLEFMRRRLILMRECMADDASIYVHIGHQMVAHLKVIMDEIFGSKNFRNIITRRKCSSKNFTKKQYSNLNDYILFYSKTDNYKWFKPGEVPSQEWKDREYPKTDDLGRKYKLVPVHAPGTRNGETGTEWRGKMPPPGKHWQYLPSRLDELDAQGDIHWSKNGNPRRKVYWTDDKKLAMTDYWSGYRDAHHQSIKITGYPTEKNFEMLKMIVGASSEEGDLVVDPFCGSGTAMHAAMDMNRKFIGFDASFTAAKSTIKRFRHGIKAMGDYVSKHEVIELFPDNSNEMKKLHFLVEASLWNEHQKGLKEIAKL